MPKPISELPERQVTPAPALEKRARRRYTAEYKLRILTEADACQYGELGGLLRRENLYGSQLKQWRKEFAELGAEGLAKTQPGSKPSKTAEGRRIEHLEKENAKLQKRLRIATDCLDLQKKALSMLDQTSSGNDA
ncbi:MAG: transposase [Pseudomonadota bacterium]